MWKRVYCFAICLTILPAAAGFLAGKYRIIDVPYEFDYGEGLVLWQSMQLHHLENMYKPIERAPFEITHYTPLYHWALQKAGSIYGGPKLAGRLISLVSTLGAAISIASLLFVAAPRRMPLLERITAACFGGALIFHGNLLSWAAYVRVDLLGLFFVFTALALVVICWHRAWGHYVAIALLVAAVYTKQVFLAAPLASYLILLLARPAHAVRLMVFGFLLGLGPLLYLQSATHGYFLRNIIFYNINPFHLNKMIQWELENYRLILPILALALTAAVPHVLSLAKARASVRRFRGAATGTPYRRTMTLLLLAFCLSALMSTGIGKEGASSNYFIEMNLLCCALAGCTLLRWLHGKWLGPTQQMALSTVGLLVLLLSVSDIARIRHLVSGGVTAETASAKAEHAALLRAIRSVPGPVYSENMTVVLDAGKELVAEPAIVTSLAKLHVWDEKPLVDLIRNRKLDLVVVTSLEIDERYTAAARAAIEEFYAPGEKIGAFTLYRPKPEAVSR